MKLQNIGGMHMKQMKNKFLVGLLIFFSMLCVIKISVNAEEEPELKVKIMDQKQGHAIHRSIEMATEKTDFYVEAKLDKQLVASDDIEEITWKSDNDNIVTIQNTTGEQTELYAVEEGVTNIHLTVKLKNGLVASDNCMISVYTKIAKTEANLSQKSTFYRGASLQAKARNEGEVGQFVNIVASCGDFYWVVLPDEYDYKDDLNHQYSYVLKSNVNIPVKSISLEKKVLKLKKGQKITLNYKIYPELATNKKVKWKSSSKSIATVSQKGKVKTKKIGEAKISIITLDGEKTSECTVKVQKKKKVEKEKKKLISASGIKGKYSYRFENSSVDFGEDPKYYMTNKDKKKLIKCIMESPQNEYKEKELKSDIKNEMKMSWGGSCYGMTMSMVSNKGKIANIKKYCAARGLSYDLRYIKKPKTSKRVMSTINFFQISQMYINDENYLDSNYYLKFWEKVAKNARKGIIQELSISFPNSLDGHSILVTELKKMEDNTMTFITYDPSYPKETTTLVVDMVRKTAICTSWGNIVYDDCQVTYDFEFLEKIDIDN